MKHEPIAFIHKGDAAKQPLQYTECGLDDVYLLSGYEIEQTPHGEGLSIKGVDQLHKTIGCYLAKQKKVLSGKELRFLRLQMNLTQSALGRFIGLSSQQVARWEKGESDISGPADLLVRALYIQHLGSNTNLQELAQRLDEIDSPATEKAVFENTSHGWKHKKVVNF
jgi:putative transcriptional regulator